MIKIIGIAIIVIIEVVFWKNIDAIPKVIGNYNALSRLYLK